MGHKNNHELTTVAVREEVREGVEKTLGSSVTAQKKQEVINTFEQIAQKYSSPYPDQAFLAAIESLAPGSAQQIISATIEDLQHRRTIDEREIAIKEKEMETVTRIAKMDFGSTSQGRYLGFAAYIASFIFSGTMFYMGSSALAAAGFGTAAIGVITQLIRGPGQSAVQITKGPEPKGATVMKSPKTEKGS